MPQLSPALLPYGAMRMRWYRQAMWAFLRRWGAYLAVAVPVICAGVDSPVAVLAGAAAWLVMPLFHAVAHGPWMLAGVAAQALAGAALVWGARALLWPAHWAEAERALPIARATLLRSDLAVVAAALLPLWLLQAAGALSVLAAHPAWLMPLRGRAVAALMLANVVMTALGVGLLQGLRAPRRSVGPRSARPVAAAPGCLRYGNWVRALLWLPLWRGPARRSGQVLAAGSLALCLPGLAAAAWPGGASWALALLALVALLVVTRLNALARTEFEPLFEAAVGLPVASAPLSRGRAALCLCPLLPGAVAMAWGLAAVPVRGPVLLAYALACFGSCVLEVWAAPAGRAVASEKSSRWLFSLILCLCIATEVVQ
jgi:hypothetical protein